MELDMEAPSVKFNPGDLITGTDRSYTRSIYRFLGIGPDLYAIMATVSFRGTVFGENDLPSRYEELDTLDQEFRLATPEEIRISRTSREDLCTK